MSRKHVKGCKKQKNNRVKAVNKEKAISNNESYIKTKGQGKIVKIALKPLEPYFFGGMNANNGKERKYIIKSNKIPSQTTLFGVLRYLGIKNPKANFTLEHDNNENRIGKFSYSIIKNNNKDSFGNILEISPLFLEKVKDKNNSAGKYLIKAPKDYNCIESKDDVFEYKALSYNETYAIGEGLKPLPNIGNTKDYILKEFIEIDKKEFEAAWLQRKAIDFIKKDFLKKEDEEKIFSTQSKVGIKISDEVKTDENFYRKEYAILNDYSFSFYAKVDFPDDDDFYKIKNKLVFMGQGKSTFSASVEYIGELSENKIEYSENEDHYKKFYAMSDVYLGGICEEKSKDDNKDELSKYTMKSVLDSLGVKFVFSGIEPYRQLIRQEGSYKKQANQLNMISAGSVFLVDKNRANNFDKKINNEHLRIIGLNNVMEMSDQVIINEDADADNKNTSK